MNTIQRASSSSYQMQMKPLPSRDTEMRSLMRQRSLINEQIAEVKSNQELDNKVKTERIKALTTELQLIDAQIAQKRAEQQEERKPDSTSSQPSSSQPSSSHTNAESNLNSPVDHILAVHTLYNNIGKSTKLTSVRSNLKNEAVTIQSEIKQDRLHLEGMPAAMRENAELTVIKKKTEQEAAVQAKAATVDQKIGSAMREINQAVQDTASQPAADEPSDDQWVQSAQETSVKTSQASQQKELGSTYRAIDVRI